MASNGLIVFDVRVLKNVMDNDLCALFVLVVAWFLANWSIVQYPSITVHVESMWFVVLGFEFESVALRNAYGRVQLLLGVCFFMGFFGNGFWVEKIRMDDIIYERTPIEHTVKDTLERVVSLTMCFLWFFLH